MHYETTKTNWLQHHSLAVVALALKQEHDP